MIRVTIPAADMERACEPLNILMVRMKLRAGGIELESMSQGAFTPTSGVVVVLCDDATKDYYFDWYSTEEIQPNTDNHHERP